MNSEKNKNERPPIQLQEQHKKWLVFTALTLLFAGAMYMIFAPSVEEKKRVKNGEGMNVSIPQATNAVLLDDKQSAYEQRQLAEAQERKREQIASLSELFQNDTTNVPHSPSKKASTTSTNAIGASVSAYRNINNTLDNFYVEDTSEKEALQEEIEALKLQLAAEESAKSKEQRQLALMEKSYEMASKYLPRSAQGGYPSSHNGAMAVSPVQSEQKVKRQVTSVQQHKDAVVSSLQERQWIDDQFFTTAVGTKHQQDRNTISACIHKTTKISQNETVPIRLLEAIQVGNIVVPAQTVLTAQPKLDGNRLLLTISSIQYQGVLLPVELVVYDLKGQKGIAIPATLEQNAVKQILASLGNASGTGIAMNNSASEQLLTDMGRGVLQGSSNYLKSKIQQRKITVKAAHHLLLISEKQ